MRGVAATPAAILLVTGAAWAGPEHPVAASRAVPKIQQMVVFRSGKAVTSSARPRKTSVRVGGEPCKVAARTPLALLVRSGAGKLRLRDDFASCPASAAGVYVVALGPDAEQGAGGWVYKVGRKAATAGAGDPAGPLGSGRLRKGQRVLWFYCRQAGNCQRTLSVKPSIGSAGEVVVRVIGYDDNGDGVPIEGATVRIGPMEAETGADGTARSASLPPGRHRVVARKDGLVRSPGEWVTVK